MEKYPIVSVITVVYNGAMFVERTIKSVAQQTYPAIQYIVIDGASTDATLSIVERNKAHIAYRLSEPDKGLYDAMNKGLRLAEGDYVCFMNAGDTFRSRNTLREAMAAVPPDSLFVHGDTMIVATNGNEIGMRRLQAGGKLSWHDFSRGMLVCHQAMLVHRSIAPLFDLRYRYSADYDWAVRCLKAAGAKTAHTNSIVANFMDGGQTSKTIIPGLRERFRIMATHYGYWPTLMRHFTIGLRFFAFWLRNKRF